MHQTSDNFDSNYTTRVHAGKTVLTRKALTSRSTFESRRSAADKISPINAASINISFFVYIMCYRFVVR